jgi:hypothetical protein
MSAPSTTTTATTATMIHTIVLVAIPAPSFGGPRLRQPRQ